MHGFLITHTGSISIADDYTLRDAAGAVLHRPTCHYAYHPCDDAVLSGHELAGMVFAIENPNAGVVEADEPDHARALETCLPYLGEMAGVYSDWTPLQDRGRLFPESVDTSDPWQFAYFHVT